MKQKRMKMNLTNFHIGRWNLNINQKILLRIQKIMKMKINEKNNLYFEKSSKH